MSLRLGPSFGASYLSSTKRSQTRISSDFGHLKLMKTTKVSLRPRPKGTLGTARIGKHNSNFTQYSTSKTKQLQQKQLVSTPTPLQHLESVLLLNNVSSPLTDNNSGRVCVSGGDFGENGGVDDTEPFHFADAAGEVDDGVFVAVGTHAAGGRGWKTREMWRCELEMAIIRPVKAVRSSRW